MKNILGERLKRLRENTDMSQRDLAKLLNVESNTLSQYESGTRTPNDSVKIKICDIFNTNLDYLVGRDIEALTNKHGSSLDLKEIIGNYDISYSDFQFNDSQKHDLVDFLNVFVNIYKKNE